MFGTTTLLCNATMSARANSVFAQLVTRASDTASEAATPARDTSHTTMSRESLDALEAAAARRRAAAVVPRVEAPAPPPAEAEPSADAELSEASAEPAEPRAASPATAEVEPHADAEPCAEVKFDWNAKPGPAKFAAFTEAFPYEKHGGPAYVPTYPPQKK